MIANRKSKIQNQKWAGLFAIVVALMLFAICFSAEAQQAGKVYRVGYISARDEIGRNEDAFRKRMHELGYVEGKNFVIDWRFASGKTSLFPDLAAELVRLNVDAIVGQGVDATGVAKKATTTIPIVMSNADDDPVRLGLIASLARPGGNVTGLSAFLRRSLGSGWNFLRRLFPKRLASLFSRDQEVRVRLPPAMLRKLRLRHRRWGYSLRLWRREVVKIWRARFEPHANWPRL